MKIRGLILTILLLSISGVYSQNTQKKEGNGAQYSISIPESFAPAKTGHLNLGGVSPSGGKIDFNSQYMSIDGKPFIPVMGEMHYLRFPHQYWEEQILKMKSGGINVIATYVFWNMHEQKSGVFDWEGDKNLRQFIELCWKHDMYTIVRIGPFCHGEIRNGGLPDWIYGRPFEVRSNDEGYLFYTRRLYKNIAGQIKGLYYKDGGPIIGIQLENELQHSAALWAFHYPEQDLEWTTANYDADITLIGVGVQDRETEFAKLGSEHLATLKQMAIEEGIVVPLYTVTGWGNAAVLENEAIPVTSAYPYPFWTKPEPSNLFLFKDIQRIPDYSPVRYNGADYPSFCAEMGVGIQITYERRPRVPGEASEALMLRSLGSGSNGIGYYMYHGGITPQSSAGDFMSDELAGVPKMSYDFQAPLGEYGKVRDSYFNLKLIHHLVNNFGDKLAPMSIVIPETNKMIKPEEKETLRYAVRSDGNSGFVFMHNFQDHDVRSDQEIKSLHIQLHNEIVHLPSFTLKKDACAILPFNMHLGSSVLKFATVQPLATTMLDGKLHYFFFAHEGIPVKYAFDKKTIRKTTGRTTEKDGIVYVTPKIGLDGAFTIMDSNGLEIVITTLNHRQALSFNQWESNGKNHICLTEATVIQNKSQVSLQSMSNIFTLSLPSSVKPNFNAKRISSKKVGAFTEYIVKTDTVAIDYKVKEANYQRYTFAMDKKEFKENLSDIILEVDYVGELASAFIDGEMINDNFSQGNKWNIGLKRYAEEINEKGMYFYFKPLNKGASFLIDFDKSKVPVFDKNSVCKVNSIKALPEYTISFEIK